MLEVIKEYKNLLNEKFEIDDWQAVDILIACALSHKLQHTEPLWVKLIGASGSGKTELLRTLSEQKDYCIKIESITPGSISRGHVVMGKKQDTMLERANGKLVITKEFAPLLTKDMDSQRQIFGLLRSVYDGELVSDFGSEQGYIEQKSSFDWIIGSTGYADRIRNLETLLGSRFLDLRWGSPENRLNATSRAIDNDNDLFDIRLKLSEKMHDVLSIEVTRNGWTLDIQKLVKLADITARFRTPVERNKVTKQITDIPDIELGTRIGQTYAKISFGLLSMGIENTEVYKYLIRMTFDCMPKVRALIIKSLMMGLTIQSAIAENIGVSTATVSNTVEELKILGWKDEFMEVLK